MITFNNREYELFFSNNLPPLIALNYADEPFFEEFDQLCGKRYRILSIIRNGWQQKYGLASDVKELGEHFEAKIDREAWANNIFEEYELKSKNLREFLEKISSKNYAKADDSELIRDIKEVRNKSAVLDAMSNMLHMFSSLVGYKFLSNLHKYSDDNNVVNQNFVFFTQPIKESRFAKIKIKGIDKKLELSEHDRNFSNILRMGAFIKDDVSELLDMRKELMQNLFIDVAKRLKCKSEDLEYLQIKEIEGFLLNKKDPANLIRGRRTITILYYPEKRLEVYEGDKAEAFLKKGDLKEIVEKKEVKILKGQTASLGKVKGKVVVALDSKEAIKKMGQGNILIAPYTAVEYVPAMKRACAIITETGGVTSHAAIVSREFKIPCVVGVKDATKILKDGQEVEVDGDQGVVKVLD